MFHIYCLFVTFLFIYFLFCLFLRPKKVFYLKTPFILESCNTKIRLETTKLLGRFYPQNNFKFIFNNNLSIEKFSILRTVFLMSCKGVSSINSTCGQLRSTYIGETYRHLSTRITEHKGISIRTGQTLLNPPHSSICYHALQEGHAIILNCFSIIHQLELSSINISEGTLKKRYLI